MSRGPAGRDPRAELIEHLRFLREIGVREIRAHGIPPAAARPGSASESRILQGTPPRTGSVTAAAGISASRATPTPAPARAPATKAATVSAAGPKASALAQLRDAGIGDCRRCRLCESRTHIVFGVGDPGARLMFVGEGPGHDEDVQGIPFVGRAGQLLTDIIRAMGLTREQVYIANVVKCRPPENRTPEPDEVAACRGFLERQIEIIAPRVIVCLGAVAVQTLLGAVGGITKIRGRMRELHGIPVMPTFHPAYLLRNPAAKKDVWQDMKQVMALLAAGPAPG